MTEVTVDEARGTAEVCTDCAPRAYWGKCSTSCAYWGNDIMLIFDIALADMIERHREHCGATVTLTPAQATKEPEAC